MGIDDRLGLASGKICEERFLTTTDRDTAGGATDAEWGTLTTGTLEGKAVTSRLQKVQGQREAGTTPNSGRGQYAVCPNVVYMLRIRSIMLIEFRPAPLSEEAGMKLLSSILLRSCAGM